MSASCASKVLKVIDAMPEEALAKCAERSDKAREAALANNSMQRTALRAAADAGRSPRGMNGTGLHTSMARIRDRATAAIIAAA